MAVTSKIVEAWDPGKHPRDPHGRWGSGGVGSGVRVAKVQHGTYRIKSNPTPTGIAHDVHYEDPQGQSHHLGTTNATWKAEQIARDHSNAPQFAQGPTPPSGVRIPWKSGGGSTVWGARTPSKKKTSERQSGGRGKVTQGVVVLGNQKQIPQWPEGVTRAPKFKSSEGGPGSGPRPGQKHPHAGTGGGGAKFAGKNVISALGHPDNWKDVPMGSPAHVVARADAIKSQFAGKQIAEPVWSPKGGSAAVKSRQVPKKHPSEWTPQELAKARADYTRIAHRNEPITGPSKSSEASPISAHAPVARPGGLVVRPVRASLSHDDVPVQSFRDDLERKKSLRQVMGKRSDDKQQEQDAPGIDEQHGLAPGVNGPYKSPDDEQKYSKEQTNYRYAPDPLISCGTCKFYVAPGSCQIVAGTIRPVDVCDKWEKGSMKPAEQADNGENMNKEAGTKPHTVVFSKHAETKGQNFPKEAKGKNFPMEAKVIRPVRASLSEVTPPGGEKVVRALKKEPGVENPWAVAWAMKRKGQISEQTTPPPMTTSPVSLPPTPTVMTEKKRRTSEQEIINSAGLQKKVYGPSQAVILEPPKPLDVRRGQPVLPSDATDTKFKSEEPYPAQ